MGVVSSQYEEPFAHFDAWFEEARGAEALPEAASMATVGGDGRPSNRMVLVRWRTGPGFDVYTDLESRKGEQLRANASASLCWWWPVLQRQVRVEGAVEFLDDAAGDAYWESRPRGAQVAAAASRQSQVIESAEALDEAYGRTEASHTPYVGVPRPARWGGVRVLPERVEFWTQRPNRLHERVEYVLEGGVWVRRLLQP